MSPSPVNDFLALLIIAALGVALWLVAKGLESLGGDQPMSAENVVGLLIAAALIGYLVFALIFPERF